MVRGSWDTYDAENSEIAAAALRFLKISEASIREALKMRPPCRMEVYDLSTTIIFDVAHNPSGILRLLESLKIKYREIPLQIVCGFSSNKEISKCLEVMRDLAAHVYCVSSDTPRSAKPELLLNIGQQLGLKSISSEVNIEMGVKKAIHAAKTSNQIVLICGSFFIMDQALKAVGIPTISDNVPLVEHFKSKV